MIYQILGLALIMIGFAHKVRPISTVDNQILIKVQHLFNRNPWLNFFQELWFLGRTPFALIVISSLILISWKRGLIAALTFLVIVGIEQIIKSTIRRPRPFESNPEFRMLQPIQPEDPSFPSGDALRIWFIALIIPLAAGQSSLFLAGCMLIAFVVSMGRMVLGVHYPTDVISGTGLGILGASTSIWLWHIFIH
jgi:undecaprenyl-diphosphatase